MKLKLSVHRRNRTTPFGYELHRHDRGGFLNLWIGSPTHHRWWATSVYLYWAKG